MKRKNRYDELLFIAETCQASTMAAQFYSPDVLAVGSSGKGENSLSHHNDDAIGLSVIDRFTFYTLEFMEAIGAGADAGHAGTADAWFRSLTKGKVRSTAEPIVNNYARDLRSVRVTDFFGSVTEASPAAVGYGAAKPRFHAAPRMATPRAATRPSSGTRRRASRIDRWRRCFTLPIDRS